VADRYRYGGFHDGEERLWVAEVDPVVREGFWWMICGLDDGEVLLLRGTNPNVLVT
jgi:hypothetical protein